MVEFINGHFFSLDNGLAPIWLQGIIRAKRAPVYWRLVCFIKLVTHFLSPNNGFVKHIWHG